MISDDTSPTQAQLDTFADVLDWVERETRKHEPYALEFLGACEVMQDTMGFSADDYEPINR